MCLVFFATLLFLIKFAECVHEDFNVQTANCTLDFTIQTIQQSHTIQTDFPIHLSGEYYVECPLPVVAAHVDVKPLQILIFGHYIDGKENVESMVSLNSTIFYFTINESSTVRLCLSFSNNSSLTEKTPIPEICNQIHIGINTLYEFWTWPMKTFYICLLLVTFAYYIFFLIRERKRRVGQRVKAEIVIPRVVKTNENHDTFENEKIHDQDVSDGDYEDNE